MKRARKTVYKVRKPNYSVFRDRNRTKSQNEKKYNYVLPRYARPNINYFSFYIKKQQRLIWQKVHTKQFDKTKEICVD